MCGTLGTAVLRERFPKRAYGLIYGIHPIRPPPSPSVPLRPVAQSQLEDFLAEDLLHERGGLRGCDCCKSYFDTIRNLGAFCLLQP